MNTHDNHHLVHWFSMTISGSLVQGRKKHQYHNISCGRGTDDKAIPQQLSFATHNNNIK